PGDHFNWVIDVSNPNDCVLDNVRVVDTITAAAGVRYHVVSSSPPAKDLSDGRVTFDDVGPLRQGESRRLLVEAAIDDISAPGSLRDVATADGACGPEHASASDAAAGPASAPVPMTGRAELAGPMVGVVREAAAVPLPAAVASADLTSGTADPATAPPTAIERQRLSLARTGGLLGIIPAWMMLSGGSLLRRFRRRRCRLTGSSVSSTAAWSPAASPEAGSPRVPLAPW